MRLADSLVGRMDVPLEDWQRIEVRSFLFERLFWHWPSPTLRRLLEVTA